MRKKTKIVATISDKTCSLQFIDDLYENGMDVVRLNTAHQTPDEALKAIKLVREVNDKIPVMLDTKGPEIRTTIVNEDAILVAGETAIFTGDPDGISTSKVICVNYRNFADDINIDDRILYDDGEIEFVVREINQGRILCEIINGGILKSRKSINVPGVSINLPSLSDKDRKFIDLAIKHDVEFIAHSFVRRKEDVLDIKEILDKYNSKVKIISKIENQEGINNIDEILDVSYGIMVARGDLGIEVAAEKLPGIQKKIVKKCRDKRKPVIIATQMMHSMIENPRPTRAEVTDVATAITEGTDAIMLSGETAYGKYPIESVQTMSKIAKEVEKDLEYIHDEIPLFTESNRESAFLTKAAVQASEELSAKVIITDTHSGRTVRDIAAYRGKCLVFAECYEQRTMREMALSYGVYADYMDPRKNVDDFKHATFSKQVFLKQRLDKDDLVVLIAGNYGRSRGATFIEINKASDLFDW